eukprot:TRINITY_DN1079_c0_g1_i4.p1 TRINITY_DN1079_c0_g1~~TRINITY_DN1079_c0_g1_i4.p1  ORF type:complete len:509 (+),score=161.57 TRINITY_DN1079_c0_g1_i4:1049-2575(+)
MILTVVFYVSLCQHWKNIMKCCPYVMRWDGIGGGEVGYECVSDTGACGFDVQNGQFLKDKTNEKLTYERPLTDRTVIAKVVAEHCKKCFQKMALQLEPEDIEALMEIAFPNIELHVYFSNFPEYHGKPMSVVVSTSSTIADMVANICRVAKLREDPDNVRVRTYDPKQERTVFLDNTDYPIKKTLLRPLQKITLMPRPDIEKACLDFYSIQPLGVMFRTDMSYLMHLLDTVDIGALDKLCEALVEFMQMNGGVMPLIMERIRMEVERTSKKEQLFRSNSVATKLCSQFAKTVGTQFLQKSLAFCLAECIMDPSVYEIDPANVDEETALDNKAHIFMVTKNIFDAVYESIDQLPESLKFICAQVRDLVTDKFGEESSHIAVAGFVFLRFVTPALVSPDGFKLVSSVPSENSRKVLIISAKILQNMANGVEFGVKEPHMKYFNRFINANQKKMVDILDMAVQFTETEFPSRRDIMFGDMKTQQVFELSQYQEVVDQLTALESVRKHGMKT